MDSTLDLNMFDSLIASYNEESFIASEIEDIDAPFGPPHGPEVTTSEDVQQSRKANVEDFEGSYTFLTPNGTKVWCPNKGCDLKPTVGFAMSLTPSRQFSLVIAEERDIWINI
ncbi:hypothetical protein E3N88_23112 [Mikania micrantha]|uniref:Uncharacterized protein n=1 Tax=Mikania micrantha TaxID=192012 RepID=A0A5N6NCD4_9ASTR|nr:hypothetical protein E3N88_23112 [Mikania micrantha]